MEDEIKHHAAHGFTHSTVEHHHDGSHTVRIHHHQPEKSISKAVPDLEGVHQALHDNLAPPEAAAGGAPPMPTTAATPPTAMP
jgi:hypothetical protein